MSTLLSTEKPAPLSGLFCAASTFFFFVLTKVMAAETITHVVKIIVLILPLGDVI